MPKLKHAGVEGVLAKIPACVATYSHIVIRESLPPSLTSVGNINSGLQECRRSILDTPTGVALHGLVKDVRLYIVISVGICLDRVEIPAWRKAYVED